MKTMEELKKDVQENKGRILAAAGLAACIGGYVGLTIWERKTFKTVNMKDWMKVTGQSTFDDLLDKKIVGAFVTVEYEDGTIGIVKNVVEVAKRLTEEA